MCEYGTVKLPGFYQGDSKQVDDSWNNKFISSFRYVDYYKLPKPTDNVLEFLAFIAKEHNMTIRKRPLQGKLNI